MAGGRGRRRRGFWVSVNAAEPEEVQLKTGKRMRLNLVVNNTVLSTA